MNQQQRIDDFIAKYQKLNPHLVVTNETRIKGQSIDQICRYATERPYGRLITWLDKQTVKKEVEPIQQPLIVTPEKTTVQQLDQAIQEFYNAILANVEANKKLIEITREKTATHYAIQKARERLASLEKELMN